MSDEARYMFAGELADIERKIREADPGEVIPLTEQETKARNVAKVSDPINNPDHYALYEIEPGDFIGANGFNFQIGNVIKYVSRAGLKVGNDKVQDLKKAKRYIEMEINITQGERACKR